MIANLDIGGQVLSATRVFFNFLHLPINELHYTIQNSQLVPTYQATYEYTLDPNIHARSTNYSMPTTTEQFRLDSSGTKQPLRRSTAGYDQFGCPVTNTDEMWNAKTSSYVKLTSTTSTYTTTKWNLEMLRTEIFFDQVSGQQRLLTYTLTPDEKSLAQATTQYMNSGDTKWQPWKQKSFTYDANGRPASETLAWSNGADIPSGTVSSFTNTMSYLFNKSQSTLTTTTTDPQGNSSKSVQSTNIWKGPVVQKQLAMGETEYFEFDQLGRLRKYTNPMGKIVTTEYAMGTSENSVTTTNSVGYVTKRFFDGHGNKVQIADNGDPTQAVSPTLNRVLALTKYDSLSRPTKKTNELGLVTTLEYDALNRLTKTTDYLGNVTTVVHDDAALTQTTYINGSLRALTQKDAFGRVVSTTSYADSDDKTIQYCVVHETDFSGFGLQMATRTYQQLLSDQSKILVFESDRQFDAEYTIREETGKGIASDLSSFDSVQRQYQHDIFGNIYSYSKSVQYSDGKKYDWQSARFYYDDCGRYVKHVNQLGQEEEYTYDADGFMASMIRFDKSVVKYSRDAVGQMTRLVGTTETIDRTYSDTNRISKVQSQIGGGSTETYYQYTLDGSAVAVINADGSKQTYVLDKTSRITQASDALGSVQTTRFDNTTGLVSSRAHSNDTLTYAYGTVNHTIGTLVGSSISGAHPLDRTITYDGYGRVVRNTVRNPQTSKVVLDNAYVYNSRDKIIMVQAASEAFADMEDLNYTRSFEYDGLSQLRKDSTKYSTTGRSTSRAYTFDGNSNVVAMDVDGVVTQMSYNAIDQRTDPGFSWDTNGRLLTDDAGRSYTYHSSDQLASVTVSEDKSAFSYDARGALSHRGTKDRQDDYFYDMGSVNSMRSTASGSVTSTSYLQEPGRRIAAYSPSSAAQYLLETQGSTALTLEGSSGNATDYSAYGESTASSNTAEKPLFGYKQELTDPHSGLVYLRSRFYQPACQSFITLDIAQKENRYAYCHGDPINSVDRTGQSAAGMVVGGVVGAAVTLLVGVGTGGVGAVVFGPECIEASIAAGATAGALGNLSGDGARAAVDKDQFSLAEGVEDVISGGIGGAVGTGLGSVAGSRAMSACLARGMTQRSITIVGSLTSGGVGGASGGFSGNVSMDIMTGKSPFNESTALSTVTGAVGGLGGGFLGSMAYLGVASSHCIPVPLTANDLDLIVPAVKPDGVDLPNKLYVMAPQSEAQATYDHFNNTNGLEPEDALRLKPKSLAVKNSDRQTFDTVAAHGMGRTIMASVAYGEIAEPDYVRPISGKLFAEHMASVNNNSWIGGGTLKFLSCYSAFGNAQDLSAALQRDVYGSYEAVNRYSANTAWKDFKY